MRNLQEVQEFRLSPRVAIRPGDLVRFAGGGPVYRGERFTLPGKFLVRKVLRAGQTQRFFLEVHGLDKTGGTHTPMVSGRQFAGEVLTIRPYRVRRIK